MSDESSDLKDKTSLLVDVLKRYDHYVATTNFKAALMMSFLGAIVLGLTMRVMFLQSVQQGDICIRYAAIIVSVLTILSSLFAAVQLLRVVFPDTKNSDGAGSVIFFGTVVSENKTADEYYGKVASAEHSELLRDLATQTYNVAGVVNQKFKVLKVAVNTVRYITVPLLAAALILLIIEGHAR